MSRDPKWSMPAAEVEATLEVADFLAARGLHGEARAAIEALLGERPDHPLLREKLRELPPDDGATRRRSLPTRTSPAVEATGSGRRRRDADVTSKHEKLATEKTGKHRRVAIEKTSPRHELVKTSAHHKLAVLSGAIPLGGAAAGAVAPRSALAVGAAYRRMGLVGDAEQVLAPCANDPRLECSAHLLLGLCRLDRHDVKGAIRSYKRALFAETKTSTEEIELYYELGRAYELMRDPEEAIFYYRKVDRRRPGFRDIEDRVRRLRHARCQKKTAPYDAVVAPS